MKLESLTQNRLLVAAVLVALLLCMLFMPGMAVFALVGAAAAALLLLGIVTTLVTGEVSHASVHLALVERVAVGLPAPPTQSPLRL